MRRILLATVVFVLFTGCISDKDAPSRDGPAPEGTDSTTGAPATPTGTSPARDAFRLHPLLSGLDSPVHLTHAGDGSGRLFIVEQPGRIRIARQGQLVSKPFLDVTGLVQAGGERGLLSVAFPADYETSGWFIVDYTRRSQQSDEVGDSVIARYRVSSDPDVADPASADILLVIDQPQANHNGGLVSFGPDGMLYIGSGDGGGSSDAGAGHAPEGNGQALGTLLGKLLRIEVGAEGPYRIPQDNPDLGPGARGEIWAYGLRNPWRFSFDRATGDLYIADVGQNMWEEVDHQPQDSRGGENYGWPVWEGSHLHRPGTAVVGDRKPVAEYEITGEHCSITGGHAYRGARIPALHGYYLLGDFCSGNLWTLAKVDERWSLSPLMDTDRTPSSFGEDEDGELYLVDHQGSVHLFAPN